MYAPLAPIHDALARLPSHDALTQPPSHDALALQTITQGEPALVTMVLFVFLLGLGAIYFGHSTYRTGRLIEETPTVDVGSVSSGRAGFTGVARPADEPLEHPYSDEECLHYSYRIREQVEKEGQRDRDRDDASPIETEWRTVARGSDAVPFYVEDGTGELLVAADEGATFDLSGKHADSFSETQARKLGYEVGPVTIEAPRETRKDHVLGRTVSHDALHVGDEVYVFGGAERRDVDGSGGAELVVAEDEESGTFIVTDKDGDSLARTYSRTGPLAMLAGVLVSASSVAVLVYDYVLV